MTATAFERCHLFHQDGVRNTIAETPEQYDRLMAEGCWVDVRVDAMPEAPPPPPPPMTADEQIAVTVSEVEGLGDQVDAQAQTLQTVEERIGSLERDSHPPFDFGPLIERVDKLEQRVDGQVGTASGTWARIKVLEDTVKDQAAILADVKASMDQAAPVLAGIMGRMDALEARKSKQ